MGMSTPRPEMTTSAFWLAAAERAIKTAAQVAAALIGTGAVGVTELDWQQIGSVAAVAAIVSLLTSLASDRVGAPGPSLVGEPVKAPAPETPAPMVFPPAVRPTTADLPTIADIKAAIGGK